MTGKHDGKTKTGTCPLCGGALYEGMTIMTFNFDTPSDIPSKEEHQIIVVKGIPAEVCEQCGEAYATGNVLDEVHELVSKVRATQTQISLLSYKVA